MHQIAALLENATMVGSDLMAGKTAPRQKGTLASLQHHEADGRIPGRSSLRSDGKRKKTAHKHKNAAHHSDVLIKRGETPVIARSPSGNGFVALDGDSDSSASSDRSTAATESSTPWKTREKAAEPKKKNRARRLSENEAALVIQGRFRQHQDRKRNDRPPPVYRGDRSMAMRDLADSGSATPRTPKSTAYTRDVHMTHDDAVSSASTLRMLLPCLPTAVIIGTRFVYVLAYKSPPLGADRLLETLALRGAHVPDQKPGGPDQQVCT